MKNYPPTIIWRHRRENLKKCSLKNLENRKDIIFYSYPKEKNFSLDNYILLTLDSKIELSEKDDKCGLFLIDGTWKLANKMLQNIPKKEKLLFRTLPKNFLTAYPRKQTLCLDPKRGLASIEALYISYLLLNRNVEGLLDHYYFKDKFLEKNFKKSTFC